MTDRRRPFAPRPFAPRRFVSPLSASRIFARRPLAAALALMLAPALTGVTGGAALAQTAAPEADATLRIADQAPPLNDLAGPYLAARQASNDAAFAEAAAYYARAAAQDPANLLLLDNLLYATVANDDIEAALRHAEAMEARGITTDMSRLVVMASRARAADWPGLLAALDAAPDADVSGSVLMEGMQRAWAQLGEGRAGEAIAGFESLQNMRGARGMVNYNLALAKALVGDYEGALALVDADGAGQHMLGQLAKAEMLAQLDRTDEALAVLDAIPGGTDEPAVTQMRAALAAGADVPFTAVRDARDGIAQIYLTFATVLGVGPDPDPLSLVHARLAVWVQPDLAEARLVLAQILLQAGKVDMAAEQYDRLATLGPVRPYVELTRIDALARAGRADEAIAAAEALSAAHPDLPEAWTALGDLMRQNSRFPEAAAAYDRTLSLIDPANDDARWFPLYARAISLERAGDFPAAEADFRAALAIRPDHPQILNYLGYSYIDRNENLDEALEMIRKAVEAQPDGYILDSLGWGYYRLGRYQEAVGPMEQAVAAMADDPLVNDHLGDVYWMAGRHREAEIQWRRALSLLRDDTPSSAEVDPDRIRAKLERGLDAVLADEAAGRPLMPASAD